MRPLTMGQAQWRAEKAEGEALMFELHRGGSFSERDEYGLRVIGKTAQTRLSGKNLFDQSKITQNCGSYYNSEDRLSNRVGSSSLTAVEPSTEYTLSRPQDFPYRIMIQEYETGAEDSSHSDSGWITDAEYTFTTKSSTGFLWLSFSVEDASKTITPTEVRAYPLLLELGSTATRFEPYCSGSPSPSTDYPQPIRCVRAGTRLVICDGSCEITVPCDLYDGDTWYPLSGKAELHNGVISSYNGENIPGEYISTTGRLSNGATVVYKLDSPIIEAHTPQPVFASSGAVNVTQLPIELRAKLSATLLVRR